MAADRLAEIEARAKEAQEAMRFDGLGIGYEHMGDMMRDFGPLTHDVIALVEVAKAAREVHDFLRSTAAEEGNPIFGIYERINAALARLGTGAAE